MCFFSIRLLYDHHPFSFFFSFVLVIFVVIFTCLCYLWFYFYVFISNYSHYIDSIRSSWSSLIHLVEKILTNKSVNEKEAKQMLETLKTLKIFCCVIIIFLQYGAKLNVFSFQLMRTGKISISYLKSVLKSSYLPYNM